MGWRDRDYNQFNFGQRRFTNPLWNILFGSAPLGTWFGIRVRVHASLILLIVLNLLLAGTSGGMGVHNAVASSLILFSIILLHEFGHCFAARSVGGGAEEILLWPLGGLATIDTPHRPWPTFVGAAGGPLVNVIICALSGISLLVLTSFQHSLPLSPTLPFSGGSELHTLDPYLATTATFYLGWIYSASWMLLVFNLLPIFPMDGGRILQAILWPLVGYHKSMNFACLIGMIGAAIMGAFGLATFAAGGLLLVFIAASGFLTCYQMRLALQASSPEEWDHGPDYASSLRDPPQRRRKVKGRWFKWASRKAAKERAEQAKIDAILAKVHDRGLHSLTWWEKRTLKKATERQRQQDLAERL